MRQQFDTPLQQVAQKISFETVFGEMLVAPYRAESYDMTVLAEERRDGYMEKKICFNLTAYSRVNAYLLGPDGK